MSNRIVRPSIKGPNIISSTPRPPALVSPKIQNVTQSLHRYRLQLAIATSLAVTWIHYVNRPHFPNTTTAYASLVSDAPLSEKSSRRYSTNLLHTSGLHRTSSRRSYGGERNFSTSRNIKDASFQCEQQQVKSKGEEDSKPPSSASSSPSSDQSSSESKDINEITDIGTLMRHPELLSDIKKPKNPIVLCHGLYGFDVRGPFWGLEIHYWASVLDILRKKVGAEVIVRGVPGTGAIADRASELHKFLSSSDSGILGKSVNFIGHSMGGLDARHIISVIKPKPEEYTPVSLTSISTPHRGSPFMDWCNANVGTGNDRVEMEIREAKKRMGDKGLGTEDAKEASRSTEDELQKLPFSLKTPLFVRPSKRKASDEEDSDSEAIADSIKTAAKDVAAKMTAEATSPTQAIFATKENKGDDTSTKEGKEGGDEKGEKKKKEGSSLLNLSGGFNKALASIGGSFSSYMLGVLDQPAYAMLSTRYMSQVFNPSVPNSTDVAYYSVAARKRSLPIWHPLWLPKLVLDAAAESRSQGGERDGSGDALGGETQGNDGLVSVESAKWGTFLGIMDGCDHWDLRGGGAPRWRGRVNPATGKPWPEESIKDEEKGKKKEKSWIDINTILGKVRNKDAEKKKKNKGSSQEKEESQSVVMDEEKRKGDAKESGNEDQGMLDEVASWISDRLPQGDEARRAKAEQVADEQDRKSSAQSASMSSKEESSPDEQQQQQRQVREQEEKLEEAKKLEMTRTTVKLRREAAWQEELGHDEAARDLRRELAWHRAEWDRYMTAKEASSSKEGPPSPPRPYPHQRELDWDRHTKQKTEKGESKKAASEEANELEKFWIAICRHLWAQGY